MLLVAWIIKLRILIGGLLQKPTGLDLLCFKEDTNFKTDK